MISQCSDNENINIQKWTGDVDIFAKDFLIIPINYALHWFLAIVCYPNEVVEESPRKSDYKPCILIFDSMTSYTRSYSIIRHIRR